tara:strand:- start:663 stop:1016 length:354 start_codon:yes stop_codon:yes gene_type:complete
MNIEKRNREFRIMKLAVLRIYKDAEVKLSPSGMKYISSKGRNVLSSEWPDLQLADTVYDAWKNVYITNHWTNQAEKRIDIVKNTITNTCGDTSNIPTTESYEYAEPNLEIQDEDNLI